MRKIKILGGALVIALLIALVLLGISKNKSTTTSSDFEQLDPQQGEQIGNSWNPPRSEECATIINSIAAVEIDKSYTDVQEIETKIIQNTKLAAARLSILAQKSLDKEIASWSYKAALLLVQFPDALTSGNQKAVSSLYDEIGQMVLNPPPTCDNTLNSAA